MRFRSLFHKTRNIGIFGRPKDSNIGDALLCQTCKYIIKQEAHKRHINTNFIFANALSNNTKKLEEKAKKCNIIVLPGGGINKPEFCAKYNQIVNMNKKAKVFINACGVAEYSKLTNNRRKVISELLNNKNIVQITTRGDFDTVKKLATSKHKYNTEFVLDSGIFASETYDMKKNEDSDLIGIGIIRGDIFKRQKTDYDHNDVLDFYIDLINELETRGYKWQLFCNGLSLDYEFGKSIIKKLGLDEDTYLAKQPIKSDELVSTISKYKAVIAARFHANIVSTSLDIPSVAIVWNKKMYGFSQAIGVTDRYIMFNENITSKTYVDKLEQAIEEGYDQNRIAKYKDFTRLQMSHIIK